MLKLTQPDASVSPLTIFSTHLNAPCTSLLLGQEQSNTRIYLIVGKINGETVFFPIDRGECVSKFECEINEPVTALTAGDLRHIGKRELVSVSCNGFLQVLRFPRGESPNDPPIPTRVFCQQINANVCAAEIIDIDNEKLLVVIMTDRVVRSYRFQSDTSCLVSISKYEMPTQISGWSVGLSHDIFAFLSQACQSHYIKLDFGPNKDVNIVASNMIDRRHATLLFVPNEPFSICLMQSLVEKIVVVGEDGEHELHNAGGDFVCVSHARLSSGLHAIMAVDPWGQLSIYAQSPKMVLQEPIARCQVLRDVDHMVAFPGPSDYSLFLSLVNIYNKVAIYLINLSQVVQIQPILP
ncbi:Integrin-alpha FG-GAP repeat-containing protein 2 [Aphelenchoides besseyi]|nr:Integrin-alpha FG-GAP repeat-containing protein 2 [Aphelenchoides besseyi]KAI6226957.1 Integrin-alpha FG-GAP repeat-containing protein 2 [Aphelenchoides besseyi]